VLGSYPDMSLSEARDRAGDLLRDLRRGVDPRERTAEESQAKAEAEATEQARKVNVFANVAETFINRYVASKRTAGPIGRLVRREFISRWGGRAITEIGRGDVITMVEEIAEGSPSAAHQALIYARLTRFRGHPNICVQGVHDGEDETTLPTGIPSPDGRAGPRRPLAGGTGAGV
jgi:hypothetical protein